MRLAFWKRDFTSLLVPPPLNWKVSNYSHTVMGGPKSAEISATGDELDLWELAEYIRRPVQIFSDKGDLVWWGFAAEIEINVGRWSVGINIDSMSNDIAVAYEDDENGGLPATTEWAEAADSISEYGRRELLLSSSGSNETHAMAARDKYLAELKYPIPVITPREDDGENSATIHCRGWFDTLEWRYASIATNLAHGFTNIGSVEYAFGYNRYSVPVTGMAYVDKVVTLQAANNFAVGACITVAGVNSGFNVTHIDGDWICQDGTSASQVVFTVDTQPTGATPQTDNHGTIADTICDVTGMAYVGLVVTLQAVNSFSIGELVTVAGVDAGFNVTNIDGNWIVQDGSTTSQVVFTVDTQPTGATPQTDNHGTIARMPVSQVAQGIWYSGDCNLSSISIYVKKIGAPTDNLKVSLHVNDDDITPGTELTSGTVAGSVLTTSFAWVNVSVTTYEFTGYDKYFLKLSRSGSADNDNYYVVMLDDSALYPAGQFSRLIGSDWEADSAYDMPFQLYSNDIIETTQQICTLATNYGQFISDILLENQSGLYTASARDGNANAYYEITELMKMGTSNYRRLLCEVTFGRVLRIYEEPVFPSNANMILKDGSLRDAFDTELRKETCPVGIWARLKDIVPPSLDTTRLADPTILFIDEAEYIPEEGRLNITPRGFVDPFQIGTPRNG